MYVYRDGNKHNNEISNLASAHQGCNAAAANRRRGVLARRARGQAPAAAPSRRGLERKKDVPTYVIQSRDGHVYYEVRRHTADEVAHRPDCPEHKVRPHVCGLGDNSSHRWPVTQTPTGPRFRRDRPRRAQESVRYLPPLGWTPARVLCVLVTQHPAVGTGTGEEEDEPEHVAGDRREVVRSAPGAVAGQWEYLWVGMRTGLTLSVLRERSADVGAFEVLAWARLDLAVVQPAAFDVVTGLLP